MFSKKLNKITRVKHLVSAWRMICAQQLYEVGAQQLYEDREMTVLEPEAPAESPGLASGRESAFLSLPAGYSW